MTEEDTHMADPTPGDDTGVGPGREYPGIPRWVKVFAIIAFVLILLIVIALVTGLGGPHGPGRHSPSGGSGIEPVPTFTYSSGGLGGHTLPDGPDDVTSRYFEAVAGLPTEPPAGTVRETGPS